ncbi:MAG: DUF4198 domain-containing protein [Cellvibrionaceae bacterium]
MLNPIVRLFVLPSIFLTSLLVSLQGSAHTPYYVPNTFEVSKNGLVTLDASFSERFFVPEVTFNNGDFKINTPAGKEIQPDLVSELKTRVVVEHVVKTDGTYRFSTGKRVGAVFTVYSENGERKTARGTESEIPKDSKILERYQSITMAETYVSKGAPSNAVLVAKNIGLEIIPKTNPNDLFVDDQFSGALLFDGKPLKNTEVDIYLAKNQFSSEKPEMSVESGDQGFFTIPFAKEGVYLLRVRHRAPAASMVNSAKYSSDVNSFSYTYTLVIEIYN